MNEPPRTARPKPLRVGAHEIPGRILDLLQQAIIVTDLDGIVSFMNPFAQSLYGWSAIEAVGRNVIDVTVPDLSRDQAIEIMSALRAGRSWTGEFRVKRRDGTPFLAAVTDTPICDPQGRPYAIIGVSSDVTERKRAEDALHASQARFRALADEAPVGIFEMNREGRTIYLNRVGHAILDVPEGAALGAGWRESIHPEDRERVMREWNAAIGGNKVFATEYRLRRANGRSIRVQGYARALRDRSGRVDGYMGVIIDITEKRDLQAQLVVASRLAAIGTLVAGVAREIDTPLAGSLSDQGAALEVAHTARKRLQGPAPLDRDTELQVIESLMGALQHAQQGGQRIGRMVKELSMLAGSSPGRIRVRMFDIVNQGLHWLPAEVAQGTSIQIENVGTQEIRASAGQLEQVVVNLVCNAAKATSSESRGAVVVRIGPGTPGTVRLEVIDRGVGIEPANLARIFEPFFTTRDVGAGVGLGLAVSHAIVTSHGGTLTVESMLGKGSTFRVELPSAVPEA
jgi:PAS domain S-box-containing protein